jgi:hypothetical protein
MVESDISLRHEFSHLADVFVLMECVYFDQICFTTPNIKLKKLNHIVRLYYGVV